MQVLYNATHHPMIISAEEIFLAALILLEHVDKFSVERTLRTVWQNREATRKRISRLIESPNALHILESIVISKVNHQRSPRLGRTYTQTRPEVGLKALAIVT